MYALYIGIFISPIQILVELTEMIQKGLRRNSDRFLAVMETEPEIQDSSDAEATQQTYAASFRYRGRILPLQLMTIRLVLSQRILPDSGTEDPVALAVRREAEKHTICSLLPRFYDVSRRHASRYDGKDVRASDFREPAKPDRRRTAGRLSVLAARFKRQHRLRKTGRLGWMRS